MAKRGPVARGLLSFETAQPPISSQNGRPQEKVEGGSSVPACRSPSCGGANPSRGRLGGAISEAEIVSMMMVEPDRVPQKAKLLQ
jgi:hypothetical protein